MSANWRGKIRVLAISCKRICPLIGWSAFWKLFYEDLTRKRPEIMKSEVSCLLECPLIGNCTVYFFIFTFLSMLIIFPLYNNIPKEVLDQYWWVATVIKCPKWINVFLQLTLLIFYWSDGIVPCMYVSIFFWNVSQTFARINP